MDRTLAIIQARLGSTRLPGKVGRRLYGQTLLERVVRRVSDCHEVSRVIVATGDAPENRRLRDLLPPDVPLFVGSEQDVLGRFAAACREFPSAGVVRVCADNPFIDPALIDRLVRSAGADPAADYVGYARLSGRPVILSPLGVCAEWCRTSALLEAAAEARDPADREHVTRFLYAHPERFTVRLLPLPADLDRDDVRLTVDVAEDWEHAQAIAESLDRESLDWKDVYRLLDQQPGLRQRMADLNVRLAKV